ncbi:LysR family transcriptional regulator ArgP [Glutamicibacter endophyticus]
MESNLIFLVSIRVPNVNVDLAQLQTLLAIVDAGSFDDAAIDLGVTASAVSQRMKSLESAVGAVLLVRSRPVTPTEHGRRLLRYARQIALLGAEAERELRADTKGAERMTLTVGVNADSLAYWFAPVFRELARWPELSCEFVRSDENLSLSLLRSGRASGVITTSAEVAQGCTSTRLGNLRYHAVCSESMYHAVFETADKSTAIITAPMVAYDRDDSLQHVFRETLTGETSSPPSISYIPESEQFAVAIAAGLGWGLVPVAQMRSLPQLRTIDANWHVDVPLYWQRWSIQSPALDRLGAILATAASESGLTLLSSR